MSSAALTGTMNSATLVSTTGPNGAAPTTSGANGVKPPTSPPAVAPGAASELSPEEMLRSIVDGVNAILHRSYSLVDFDTLRGVQLLQLVNDLFATLQPAMGADLETALQPTSAEANLILPRMLDFLVKTLGYRVPPFIQATFAQSFAEAEQTVLYPILYWIVTHKEQNEKRVYLSRFLQPLDIPEDIRAQDEDVRMLYQQYQQLRAAFMQTHRRVDQLRAAFADPAEARRRAATLEEERDRLHGYIQAAEKKLAAVPDRDALLAASKALRLAREEEAKLAEKMVEQQQLKITAELRQSAMSERLQHLQRDAADGRVEMMVRRLKDETQTSRIQLEEQLPREEDEKRKENAELQKLLSEPLDTAALVAEERQLDAALRTLHATVAERQRPAEDGSSLATIQQQVQRVQRRRQEVIQELSGLQAEHHRALNEIRGREANIAQLLRATNMLKEDEFKEYANRVRAMKAATESMRTRLAELRAEQGTLTFTQDKLQEQYNALDAAIGNLESKLGLQGYSRTVEALSKLTQEKDTIEEIKGKTLEELSRVVQDFTLAIRDGRARLGPMVNELRTMRQMAADVEQEWSEKKAQYEHQEALLMEDIRKLDEDVTHLKEEARVNESLYHRLQSQKMVLRAQTTRAAQERSFRADPAASLNSEFKTYEDMLASTARGLESRTKDLQARRRAIEEHHSVNVQQVGWFNNLKTLLEAKLRSLYTDGPAGGPVRPSSTDQDIQQVLGYGKGRADMLVLNNN